MTISPSRTPRSSHSAQFEQPTYLSTASDDEIFKDWLDSDTIVNSICDLSPVNTLSDLADITPEEDFDSNYSMPPNLRRVLTPPSEYEEYSSSGTRRSILFESSHMSQRTGMPSSYSRSCSSGRIRPSINRARQSVTSIASCSTIYTKSAPTPVKSILTRHDSGISLATTTKVSRKKKRSSPSVRFVEGPTECYHHSPVSPPTLSLPPSPLSSRRKTKPSRWFTRWWKNTPNTPPRPTISGPYNLGRTTSLVGVYSGRSRPNKYGRLKRFWISVTSVVR